VITTDQWRAFEHDHDVALGGGESWPRLNERVHGELDELLSDEESLLHDAHRHLAIVSHVSPIKSAGRLGARGERISGVANSTGQRFDHDDRRARVDPDFGAIQHGARAVLVSEVPRQGPKSCSPAPIKVPA